MFWGRNKKRKFLAFTSALVIGIGASSVALGVPLYLEVHINGQPTNLIGAFDLRSDSALFTTLDELHELGIATPDNLDPSSTIRLIDIAGLSYDYDETRQTINISIGNQQRIAGQYDASSQNPYQVAENVDLGAVLNYSLSAATSLNSDMNFTVPDLSASLDGWIYGPFGNISTSGILRGGNYSGDPLLRLETRWEYSDPASSVTYTVGDDATSALAWTRPIQFGGVRAKRNFELRPGFVTIPQPSLSGIAPGPSNVDIYVGEILVHSQNVPAGPFTIANIPGLTGSGEVRMVIRGAGGHETEIVNPFYTSAEMLKPGLFDFSVEAGFPRQNFGSSSFDYLADPFGAFSVRYGLTDQLTLEGHGEFTSEFVNGGVGLVASLADSATVTLAASASQYDGQSGFVVHGSLATEVLGLRIHASSQHAFGDYFDLAAITALGAEGAPDPITSAFLSGVSVPRAVDRISIGLPLPVIEAGLNLAYVHADNGIDAASHFLSANYSQQIFGNGALSFSVVGDLNDIEASRIFVGFSRSFDDGVSASVRMSADRDALSARASFGRSLPAGPGEFGWRISDTEGEDSRRNAELSYRAEQVLLTGGLSESGGNVAINARADGAIVLAGGGVFLSNRIEDAFAIVDVGAADVPVKLDNKLVGDTGDDGRLLVPGLNSYQRNKIAIDPENLPITASISQTTDWVVPAQKSGASVDFGIETDTHSAIVIFNGPGGNLVRPGTLVRLSDSGEDFIIGYDGRAFLQGLSSDNSVTMYVDARECHARFAYRPNGDNQIEIGPVLCTF